MISTTWVAALLSVVLVSLLSLIGVTTLSVNEARLRQMLFLLVSLAVGGLFGDVFIHLMPEIFSQSTNPLTSSLFIFSGLFAFFVLEKLLRWKHHHTLGGQIAPFGWLNLVADGLHNFMDGILIGSSWLVSRPLGMSTTLAVILHEIPQEIGDFGVLLQAGLSRQHALWLNFLSATLAILGALLALLLGERLQAFSELMLPFTAGSFIYLAGTDLLPELQRENELLKSLLQMVAIAAGVGLMLCLKLLE